MVSMTVKEVLEATGGRLLSGDESVVLKNISIDSRKMEGEDLFVPFVGERADAHDFIGNFLCKPWWFCNHVRRPAEYYYRYLHGICIF